MTVSRALWERLGFTSAYDFELLERATKCDRCGKTLARFARYRLSNRDGAHSDHVVCPRCKDLCNGVLGFADEGHQGLHADTLF